MPRNLATCSPHEATMFLFPIVDDIVRTIIMPVAQAREAQRTGGWFAFWRHDPSANAVVPVIGFAVGTVSAERFLKYQFFANEKADRLGNLHPEHVSSWQSRDTASRVQRENKYGGAIRCGERLYFGFSGFSEHEDEAICVLAAERLELIDAATIATIIDVSKNEPLANWRV